MNGSFFEFWNKTNQRRHLHFHMTFSPLLSSTLARLPLTEAWVVDVIGHAAFPDFFLVEFCFAFCLHDTIPQALEFQFRFQFIGCTY
jgi:hypothetical protein